ncbi:MAG: phosphatase PAP2 family protein [Alphaproteobacteria bacterium]
MLAEPAREFHRLFCLRAVILSLALLLGGCAADPGASSWVDWRGVAGAAAGAARDPLTWVPLATAAVIGVGGQDDAISRWATEDQPLFGSQSRARDASDVLMNGLVGTMLVTDALVPLAGGGDYGSSGANLLAFGASTGLVGAVKAASGRRRPDKTDRLSFPSGHADAAASAATLIAQDLDRLGMPAALDGTIDTALTGLALATGWARVEGQKHFATDVLVGAGLGHFLARLVDSSEIFRNDGDGPEPSLEIDGDQITVRLRYPLFQLRPVSSARAAG